MWRHQLVLQPFVQQLGIAPCAMPLPLVAALLLLIVVLVPRCVTSSQAFVVQLIITSGCVGSLGGRAVRSRAAALARRQLALAVGQHQLLPVIDAVVQAASVVVVLQRAVCVHQLHAGVCVCCICGCVGVVRSKAVQQVFPRALSYACARVCAVCVCVVVLGAWRLPALCKQ
jgi:hypothetical protein